jgi:outer membrane protein assembly factor BamB
MQPMIFKSSRNRRASMEESGIFEKYAYLVVLVALTGQANAENWPRFRGENGQGIATAQTVPAKWTEDDFRWSIELPGKGHSSPVIWDKRVFITSADKKAGTHFVSCYRTDDGSEIWNKPIGYESYKAHKNNSQASSTPAVDADHVYVLFQSKAGSPLIALDHDGHQKWAYDLGPYLHGQGGGTSPIVFGDLVVVCNDHKTPSFLVAVDRRTGKEVWKKPRAGKRACYATPCVFRPTIGPEQLVFSHCFEGIVGVDPKSGNQLWHIDVFGTHSQRAVGSPIQFGDLILANSGGVGGEKNAVAVRIETDGTQFKATEAYRFRNSRSPHVPSLIVYDGRLFLWTDQGIVVCADAGSGKQLWQARVGGQYFSSPICINGLLYNHSVDGQMVVIGTGDKYELIARNPIGESSHATPAVGDGKLLVRTITRLIAIGG